jgi:mRNA-degrading endonuclease RelE of RelBE toxin-antitoxin system
VPIVSKRAMADLEGLTPALRAKAETLIERLDAEPALGKKLKGKLADKRSMWLGRTHRIIYTSDPQLRVLTIVARKDAYR